MILGCATRIFDNFAELQSFLTRTYAQRYAANIARKSRPSPRATCRSGIDAGCKRSSSVFQFVSLSVGTLKQ